jgi:hypothetical protein
MYRQLFERQKRRTNRLDQATGFELGGLGAVEGRVLLAFRRLSAETQDCAKLIVRFGCNGLALNLVAESVR